MAMVTPQNYDSIKPNNTKSGDYSKFFAKSSKDEVGLKAGTTWGEPKPRPVPYKTTAANGY